MRQTPAASIAFVIAGNCFQLPFAGLLEGLGFRVLGTVHDEENGMDQEYASFQRLQNKSPRKINNFT